MSGNQKQELLPAYLVIGEDLLKREAVLRRLRIRLEEFGDLSFNYDVFDGEIAKGDEIANAARTLPFASEKRFVLVNNADKLKKADLTDISEYLDNSSNSTVICFVADKLASTNQLHKAFGKFPKTSIINCAKPDKRDLPKQVIGMAKAYGLTIDKNAAMSLIDAVGDDTVKIDSELKKLSFMNIENNTVTTEDIKNYVAAVAEYKWWDFVDAFSARNAASAMKIYERLKSASDISLLGFCTNRVRELMIAKSMIEAGRSSKQELAGALNTKDWKVNQYISWANSFTTKELHDALKSSLIVDKEMKSGANPSTAFIKWTLDVIKR